MYGEATGEVDFFCLVEILVPTSPLNFLLDFSLDFFLLEAISISTSPLDFSLSSCSSCMRVNQ